MRSIPGNAFSHRPTVGEFMTQPGRRLDRRPRFPLGTEFEWNPVPSGNNHPLSSGHWQGRDYNLALAQAAEDLGARPIR